MVRDLSEQRRTAPRQAGHAKAAPVCAHAADTKFFLTCGLPATIHSVLAREVLFS